MARTSITVQPETAMEFRAARVEMSRAGGAMMSTDDVLVSLIDFWREHRGAAPAAQAAPPVAVAVPVAEPAPAPQPAAKPASRKRKPAARPSREAEMSAASLARERQRGAGPALTTAAELSKSPEERREAAIPVKRYSCPHPGKRVIGGWCPECDVTVHHGGGLPEGYVPPWAKDDAR